MEHVITLNNGDTAIINVAAPIITVSARVIETSITVGIDGLPLSEPITLADGTQLTFTESKFSDNTTDYAAECDGCRVCITLPDELSIELHVAIASHMRSVFFNEMEESHTGGIVELLTALQLTDDEKEEVRARIDDIENTNNDLESHTGDSKQQIGRLVSKVEEAVEEVRDAVSEYDAVVANIIERRRALVMEYFENGMIDDATRAGFINRIENPADITIEMPSMGDAIDVDAMFEDMLSLDVPDSKDVLTALNDIN